MPGKEFQWIKEAETREKVLLSIVQPMTAKQISGKTKIDADTCSYILSIFVAKGIVMCLNPDARSSRLYWITEFGWESQKRLNPDLPESMPEFRGVNWKLYGWLCFNHRAAIIRILTEPLQPSEMKIKLRRIGFNIKISANNIRDIIRLFHAKGIVQKVFIRKKAHPRYELTELGRKLLQFLLKAENGIIC